MTNRYLEWKGWDGQVFGTIDRDDALYFPMEMRACGLDSMRGLRIGEIGFGNGSYAAWVKQNGGTWIGRETHPELRRRAMEAGFIVISEGDPFPAADGGGQLDLLVAFDVLEHLELVAIRAFLKEARDTLKPGGRLVFRIPSGDSPFSGVFFHGDPTHRTLLGSKAVAQLALEAGLEICQVRSPVQPIRGHGPVRSMRRLAARWIQMLVFSLIRNILMAESTAVVSPNMLVVLRNS